MRGMRLVTQGIQEEHVQAVQLVHGRLRNVAVIGEVRGRAKAITVDGLAAVKDGYGKKLQAEKIEGRPIDEPGIHLRDVGVLLDAVKDVLEAAPDGGHGIFGGEDRNLSFLPEVEGAQVVQAHN